MYIQFIVYTVYCAPLDCMRGAAAPLGLLKLPLYAVHMHMYVHVRMCACWYKYVCVVKATHIHSYVRS